MLRNSVSVNDSDLKKNFEGDMDDNPSIELNHFKLESDDEEEYCLDTRVVRCSPRPVSRLPRNNSQTSSAGEMGDSGDVDRSEDLVKREAEADDNGKDEDIFEQKPEIENENEASVSDIDRSKRFDYLLRQTEIFAHFMRPAYSEAVNSNSENGSQDSGISSSDSPRARGRPRKKKKNLLKFFNENNSQNSKTGSDDGLSEIPKAKPSFCFSSSPDYILNGQMRDYQVRGLNWLISLYENSISGILADEMGLGKTIQTIALLGYLKHYRNDHGPHLVIVPKSTLRNWISEIEKWCPSLKAVCLIGEKNARRDFIRDVILPKQWHVCVTSYDMVLRELSVLKKFNWTYLIVDEAHRIKNENALLSTKVRLLKSQNRLLLTGTPLQNNLHELWSLLNFLLPDVFNSSEDFDSWFNTNNCLGDQTLVSRLHNILRPFLLRRIKADVEKGIPPKKELKVYVGLTAMQREWYRRVLLRDMEVIRGDGTPALTRLSNILMQLRKVCNHPYLFSGAEPGPPYTTGSHLIDNCGKMVVLDKILPKFKEEGSKVLIFSQMTRMLDILEDYCFMKKHDYCRLDGQTDLDNRTEYMNDFNRADSNKFIFLLSTRAGGLGINLTGADVVIIFDSDWNPQMDLQAMDRAHRIGQTKEVRVFRLITENTVEEKIVERADVKLHLDRLIIQQGRLTDSSKARGGAARSDMLKIVRFGVEKIFAPKDTPFTDEDIDSILAKSKIRTDQIAQQFATMDESSLRHFTIDAPTPPTATSSLHEFEGVDYRVLRDLKAKDLVSEDEKSQRRRSRISTDQSGSSSSYSYYQSSVSRSFEFDYSPSDTGASTSFSATPKVVYGPAKRGRPSNEMRKIQIQAEDKKILGNPQPVPDFQFCSPALVELSLQELDSLLCARGYVVPLIDDIPVTEAVEIQKQEQSRLSKSLPLFKNELSDKKFLMEEGFRWGQRAFKCYLNAVSQYGLEDLGLISLSMHGKATEEVVAYHQVFWKRCHQLYEFEALFTEEYLVSEVTKLVMQRKQILDDKIRQYEDPLNELEISYGPFPWVNKRFTKEQDRALLIALWRVGLDSKNCFESLHSCIRGSSDYDFFLRSRRPQELHARCNFLLYMIELEFANLDSHALGAHSVITQKNSPKKENQAQACAEDDMTGIKASIVDSDISMILRPVLSPVKNNRVDVDVISSTSKKFTDPFPELIEIEDVESPGYSSRKITRSSSICSDSGLGIEQIEKNSQDAYVLVERLDSPSMVNVNNTSSNKKRKRSPDRDAESESPRTQTPRPKRFKFETP